MSKLISFLNRNSVKLLISILGISFVFLATRVPFFYYFKMPQVGPDSSEYILIVRMLKGVSVQEIGFPGVGFPLFLHFTFTLLDKLMTVVYMQTFLQFLSISILLFVYNRYYKHYFYWVLFIMLGYLGASFNQFYDSSLSPDSLLSTLFILFTALYLVLFNSTSKYLNVVFGLMSFIAVYAISVRANGVLLLPLILIYLIWFYYTKKDKKQLVRKIYLFLIPVLLLSTFNFFSPIYKIFSPIGFRKIMYEDTTGFRFETEKDSSWLYLTSIVPEGYFYKKYDKGIFNDTSSSVYVNSYSRGYRVSTNSLDSIIIRSASDVKWGYPEFNLNKFVDTFSTDKRKEMDKFKNYLKNNKSLLINIEFRSDLKVKMLLFISFFKFHYVKDYVNNFTKENDFFYGHNVKNNYWRLNSMVDVMKPFGDLSKDVFKEFYNTKLLNDKVYIDNYKTKVYWDFKSSRYNRFIVKPYYIINNFLFRNYLVPVIFVVIFCYLLFKILKRKMQPLHLLLFGIGGLLIMTNILHSFVLGFLLSRYIYQVSFIYYIFVAFVPILIFYHKKQINAK